MSDSELKSCPFCGGNARDSSNFEWARIICTKCDAKMEKYCLGDGEIANEKLCASWNARPTNQSDTFSVSLKIAEKVFDEIADHGEVGISMDRYHAAKHVEEILQTWQKS